MNIRARKSTGSPVQDDCMYRCTCRGKIVSSNKKLWKKYLNTVTDTVPYKTYCCHRIERQRPITPYPPVTSNISNTLVQQSESTS